MTPRHAIRRAVFVVSAFTAATASAGDTWDGGSGSSGNWSDDVNWDPDGRPGYGTIVFTGSTRTTNFNDNVTAMNQINWNGSSAWIMNGSSVLSLSDFGGGQAKVENYSSGLVTINAPITFAATTGANFGEINSINGDLTFSGSTLAVSGSSVSGIKLYGTGHTTTFNNTVNASTRYFGTISENTTIAVGGAFTSGDIYVMNRGTLDLTSSSTSLTSSAIRLGGDFGNTTNQNQTLGGTLRLSAVNGGVTNSSLVNTVSGNTSGALAIVSQNTANTNTQAGNVFLDAPLTVTPTNAGGTLAFTGSTFDLKGQTVTITGGGKATFSGGLSNSINSGSVVVNMSSTGRAVFSGANTYGGSTTVSGGMLQVNGSSSGTGNLRINAVGTLAGTGTISGPVDVTGTITAGSGATAGDTVGKLTTGAETWNGGGTYAFKISSTAGANLTSTQTANAGTNWDKLTMSSLSVSATTGNRFILKVIGLVPGLVFQQGYRFEIANLTNGAAPSGSDLTNLFTLDTSSLGLPNANFALVSGTVGSGESGTDLFLQYTGGTVQSTPEPATVLLAGLTGAALVGRRGRRTR